MRLKFLSWNVNGIRAVAKKGFLEWLEKESPDTLSVQETKASPGQLDDALKSPAGYRTYWNAAERKGYSGVACFVKKEPLDVLYGFGKKKKCPEGRVLVLEYGKFFLLNIYFPNGKSGSERLDFKLRFYSDFLDYFDALKRTGKAVITCGDVNTAHTDIDLARPRENSNVSGFLPEERVWLDKFIDHGMVDTLRIFEKGPGLYTWWDLKSGARQRNVGWRIDYFLVDKRSSGKIKKAFIMKDVYGSDHCPIGIDMEI